MPDEPRARIAWFTPLRPVPSGVSLYNEELLDVVGRYWPIDVFVDGYVPAPFQASGSVRIFSAREFERRDKRTAYAIVVYQFGNSPAHAYMYETALRRPGVVVLHDTVLHHLILSMVSRRGGAARYRALLARQYGAAGVRTAEQVLHGRLPHSLFDYPLSEDVIQASAHVIVHSAFSRDHVRSLVPEANVSVVPMGIRLPPRIDQSQAREALALNPDAFIVASITMVNPYKRLDVVLRALSRIRRTVPVYMLIAGSVSPHVPLQRWIRLYGLDGVVETFGFVDDRTARLVAAAADVVTNLRFPTAGETSASLLRIMAAGRPTLVSDVGSFREFPGDVVAKVPVDVLEVETVEALLNAFIIDPDLAERLGSSAREFVARHHTVNEMAAGYLRVLREVSGLDWPKPEAVDVAETLVLDFPGQVAGIDPLSDRVGQAIAEVGLGGDVGLQESVARAMVELGLQPDKM